MKKFVVIFLMLISTTFALIVSSGDTDVTTYFVFRDKTTGVVDAGVVIANIDLYYTIQGSAQAAKADASALAAANSAHSDNGAFHVGNGVYRIDWPDAAFAGANGTVVILTALDGDGGAFNVNKEIEIGPPVVLANAAHAITSLAITNTAGSALTLTSSGGNGHGLVIAGNGSGEGINITGGATGNGIQATGGSTSGSGAIFEANSGANGDGLSITGYGTGRGIDVQSNGTGHGFYIYTAGVAADSIYLQSGDDGIEIAATGSDIVADFSAVTGILGPGDYTTTVAAAPAATKTKFAIALYVATANSLQNCIIAVADASDSNKISFGMVRSNTAGGVLTLYKPLGFTPATSDLVYVTGYQLPDSGGRYGR